MTFVLIFIIATAALIVLFLIKIRAMQRDPERYLQRLQNSTEWYRLHPEIVDRNIKKTTDTVIKPTLHKALVVGFALYKNAGIGITKFMRKNFYSLLHYSLRRGDHGTKTAPKQSSASTSEHD